MATVLVTGGTGFLAGHVILRLLAEGHRVRTTLRDPSRAAELERLLARAGAAPDARPEIFVADLLADAGWRAAATGCDHVLHVASPFPRTLPKNVDDLVRPARDGTLRVLAAARDAGVRRVVVTSSFAAIGYGHAPSRTRFDETDWTDLGAPDVQPYMRSKTIAERAAWDFVAREGGGMELATVNPVGIFGPLLGPDPATSVELVRALLTGRVPGSPRIWFGIVDVRDVADLHLAAMTDPAAAGERFVAAAGRPLSLGEVAKVLIDGLGPAARKVPTRELPDWFVRLLSLFARDLRQVVPQLGRIREADPGKAIARLGWRPRSSQEALLATAESLFALGLVDRG
jgi:nucleoside-diphosphate-sugar epimerase